eukprot:2253322-Rhodomonas_salina.1
MYRGQLHRGESGVRDNWQEVMQRNMTVGFYAPTSFSRDPKVAAQFKAKTGARTVYFIEEGVGYKLDEISVFANEKEVLVECVALMTVLGTNQEDQNVGECDGDYYRATLEMREG